MKYINKSCNAMEQVFDLLLSLESAVLIESILINVEKIYIHTEKNPVSIENNESCIVVNANNLNELAKIKELRADEFNNLVINRICEGLHLYLMRKNQKSTYSIRLKLTDYCQVVQSEIKSIELSRLFIINQEEVKNEFEQISNHILMESILSVSSELEEREEAFKHLCEKYCEKTQKHLDKSTAQEISEKINDTFDNDSSLHFIHVPRHLATSYESKGRLYPKLKVKSSDYAKYIEPLIPKGSSPKPPNILDKDELRIVFDEFNKLHIFGGYSNFSDYMNLLETYVKASSDVRDTFRKRFDVKKFDIINKHSAEELYESRKRSNNKQFTNAHGLIAHCYWAIYQDDAIFSLQSKARAQSNITDYLDTLIRYYIFIEKKLLEEVLHEFIEYNSEEYHKKLGEVDKARDSKFDPLNDNRVQSSLDKRYEELRKELKGYEASNKDIAEYGSAVIKAHFNVDILKYVIQVYLHAQESHKEIIKEYKKIN